MQKRIMVLDDDPNLLDMTQEALRDEGFEVNASGDMDDILAHTKHFQPDLMIIDHNLHGINGVELCKSVKANRYLRNLPVIIISAYPLKANLGIFGCDGFIAKPFGLEALLYAVNKLVCGKVKSVLIRQ